MAAITALSTFFCAKGVLDFAFDFSMSIVAVGKNSEKSEEYSRRRRLKNNFPEYQQINSKHEVAVMCELTTQNLVQAIHSLLTDEQLHARLVANCENAKLEYNWQKESQKLLMIYRGVVAI